MGTERELIEQLLAALETARGCDMTNEYAHDENDQVFKAIDAAELYLKPLSVLGQPHNPADAHPIRAEDIERMWRRKWTVPPTCDVSENILRVGEPSQVVAILLEAFEKGVRTVTLREGGGVMGIMTFEGVRADDGRGTTTMIWLAVIREYGEDGSTSLALVEADTEEAAVANLSARGYPKSNLRSVEVSPINGFPVVVHRA